MRIEWMEIAAPGGDEAPLEYVRRTGRVIDRRLNSQNVWSLLVIDDEGVFRDIVINDTVKSLDDKGVERTLG
jgi:hypothetical protein